MKTLLPLAIGIFLFSVPSSGINAQAVSINTDNSAPDSSAILDVKSTDRGILVPRMASAQRIGISDPAIGLLVYDTDTQSFWFRDGADWINILSGKTGWSLSGNNASNSDFMGTTNNQSLLFKANNQQAGKIDLPLSNTFWGLGAGTSITTGNNNTANGYNALSLTITGNNNTAFGALALALNNGSNNTANGRGALQNNTTGSNNTALGLDALISNTSGGSNTATGANVLYSNTTGLANTASGQDAMYFNTTGNSNTANGQAALRANTTGNNNTAMGTDALKSNTTAWDNTAIGRNALVLNVTGEKNTANGFSALQKTTSGSNNTGSGTLALLNNTTGSNNVAIGSSAFDSNTTGNQNTGIGFQSDVASGALTNATAIGSQSFVGASNSIVLGSINGVNGATSSVNVGIGTSTPINTFSIGSTSQFQINSTGNIERINNVTTNFPSVQGASNTILQNDGSGNLSWVVAGSSTGWSLTGNSGTVDGTHFIGTTDNIPFTFRVNNQQSGRIDHLKFNSFFGYQAGLSNTTGISNTASGMAALKANTTGYNNTASGDSALYSNTTGYYNTALGDSALYSNTSGFKNTVIGHAADVSTGALSNATAIGSQAYVSSSNSLVLGSISGVNGATANVNVGIGTTSPSDKLEVVGNTKSTNFQMTSGAASNTVLTGDASGNAAWTPISSLPLVETDPQVSSSTANKVPIWDGSALIDGTIFDNGTNVGIGTSSPTNKLEVVGNTKSTTLQMTAGAASSTFLTGDASGNAAWTPISSLPLVETDPQVSSSTANKVPIWDGSALIDGTIFDNGTNVGIGTSSPSNKLEVVGNTKSTTLQMTAGAASSTFLTGDASGNAAWTPISSLPLVETDPQVSSSTANKVPIWDGSALIDGTIFDNGTNVGIGTSSPSNKLEVVGNTKSTTLQMTAGAASSTFLTGDASGNAAWTPISSLPLVETDPQVSSSTANKVPIWDGSALIDGTIFDNGTNVGIGTSSPSNKLEVVGNTKSTTLQMTAGAASNTVLSGDASGNATWTPISSLPLTESDPFFSASPAFGITGSNIANWNSAFGWGNHAMAGYLLTETDPQVTSTITNSVPMWNGSSLADGTIYDNGTNVGIGTSSPTNKLEVVGNTKTTNLQMSSGATNGYVLQSDASGNGSWVNSTSLPITETDPQVTSTTTNKVPVWNGSSLADGTIYDSGTNVGIGTSSPANKLEVVGNTKTDNFQMTSGATNGHILQSDAGGNASWVAPSSLVSDQWHATGNAGTTVGTNFLGTTDAQPIMFKVNSEKAGYIDYEETKANTSFGYQAYNTTGSGSLNTANGYQALFSNTSGYANTAIGMRALYTNTAGTHNTAVGFYTLSSNTSGAQNTAVGTQALYSNTTGWDNTACGIYSLQLNTTGSDNTAMGFEALKLNTTGSGNAAFGETALRANTTGYSNTATGTIALYNNTTGSENTANGFYTLFSNTTGYSNTASGNEALRLNTTGNHNTANGYKNLYSNTTGNANTATGSEALFSNTTGGGNTASGRNALTSNTTGSGNTASGWEALYTNTAGEYNTANGVSALRNNTTGSYNTSNGYNALLQNTTGTSNTATGENALRFNTSGSTNTATGGAALYSNTTGYFNTATGNSSLLFNTTGHDNTANGVLALNQNVSGNFNTANGGSALFANISGNENTASGFSALYNNYGNYNTANGSRALFTNTSGNYNTANGFEALRYNNTGSSNTATGTNALFTNNGNNNSAIGVDALYSNTTGSFNTAFGANSLRDNTTVSELVAVGDSAMYNNETGTVNTALGSNALFTNISGSNNTASGNSALYSNESGSNNTANGVNALWSNTTGFSNTAYGVSALQLNTTGFSNTAMGDSSLYSNTFGDSNTVVGFKAGNNISTGSNNLAIGCSAQVPVGTASNQIRIGNSAITNAEVQVAWTITSDKRWKSDIQKSNLGLDFISKLKPVSYFRTNDKSEKREYGFIAQELEEALFAAGVVNTGIISKDDEGMYGVRYNDLIAPMVKALQEQQVLIEELKKENAELRSGNDLRFNEQQRQINELTTTIVEFLANLDQSEKGSN